MHLSWPAPTEPINLTTVLSSRLGVSIEIVLIAAIIIVWCGQNPPDVNESHYLLKAKHYWDPSWCERDFFLRSANAHGLFYAVFGWLTLGLTLEQFAWSGRLITWLGFAIAWAQLNAALFRKRGLGLCSIVPFLLASHYCQLAGEWVIGGFEGKSVAYVLVVFGLARLVHQRWAEVPLWMAGAACFHLLVGGWSLLAAGACWVLSAC